MALEKWEHKICACTFKVTEKRMLAGVIDGHWVLTIDTVEQKLEEALDDLGRKGWELAGIQMGGQSHDGALYAASMPASLYVFKRSIGKF